MAAVLLLNLNPENALGQKNLHICDVLCRTAFATQLLRAAVVTPASVEAVEGALRRLKVARDGLTDFVYTVKLRKHLISLLNVLDTAKAKEVHEKKKTKPRSLWSYGRREQKNFHENFHWISLLRLLIFIPSPSSTEIRPSKAAAGRQPLFRP